MLYLLYEALGIAALLGSVVYAIVIPFQLFIAKYMAKHLENALVTKLLFSIFIIDFATSDVAEFQSLVI